MSSGPDIHGFSPVGSQYGNFCSVPRFFPRIPPPLLVSLRGFPINGVWLTRGGDRERGLNVGLDALLFLPAKARATEEGGGD